MEGLQENGKGGKEAMKAAKKELQESEKRVLAALDGSHTDKYDRSHALLLGE